MLSVLVEAEIKISELGYLRESAHVLHALVTQQIRYASSNNVVLSHFNSLMQAGGC